MSYDEITIHRKKGSEPDRPGWFYGRRKDRPNSDAEPMRVSLGGSDNFQALFLNIILELDEVDWFGPVPDLESEDEG